MTLLPAPQDFDGGVEISTLDKTEQQAEKEKRAKPTRLVQTRLSKRTPAWILFTLILVFVTCAADDRPFRARFRRDAQAHAAAEHDGWNPGQIDASHQFFGADCEKCHQKAFLTVRDNACLACHANTAAHADPVKFNMPALGNAECRTCHQDHNGARGLIRTDQRLCSDCHVNLKARTQNASVFEDVGDFGKSHPEFKVDLPGWDAASKFAPQRVTFKPELKENSGLKFNHVKHLKARRARSTEGPSHARLQELSRARSRRREDAAGEFRGDVPRLPHARLRHARAAIAKCRTARSVK